MVLPFYEHGSAVVLDMMRSMSFLFGLGLGVVSMALKSSLPQLIMILFLVLVLFL